ncbi:MAG TPA: CheR family methyltransferase [Vicinamibacterales bacterium]|nr:CheR family methyltransferase [Vicinamibacterales bacterium]
MPIADIEALLAARLGFDAASVGRGAVANAIRRAMEDQGATDVSAYARQLLHDAAAWDGLVERVVVPETCFFRDGVPFDFAADVASTRQRDSAAPLRILSCPCSSGEEAYSLAMALLERGMTRDAFTIRAIDVSGGAIRAARAASYRAGSFRGDDLRYRDRYFRRVDERTWVLGEAVRSLVTIEAGNAFDAEFLPDEAPFDIVFCRNLLIYLHGRARTSVLRAIRRLLAPDGVLVVGHVEAEIAREHGFNSVDRASAFAFRAGAAGTPASTGGVSRHRTVRPRLSPIASGAPVVPRNVAGATPRTDMQPGDEDVVAAGLLARAGELADAGRHAEALRVCEEHLHRRRDSANGYFLMGVLRDAMGERPLATALLKKALYLDPHHVDALRLLALAREAAGDPLGAALLRARARRADELVGAD